jgi:3-oxoacyl-[acyl-carrier protein] reductase
MRGRSSRRRRTGGGRPSARISTRFFPRAGGGAGDASRRWGRILGLGLATADRLAAPPNVTAYSIAKAGLLILVRSLAKVLAPHGVTVNAVSPGILETPGYPRPDLHALLQRIPAGHLGQVDDVVAAARFLLSEDAGYVTGANIHVSGGWGV